MRLRVKYSINGKIRFISHLDLMRVFFRACIKGNIPVLMTQGFSPHLKLSWGLPLSLGMTASGEYLDMYVEESVSIPDLRHSLQAGLPQGVTIEEVQQVDEKLPSLAAALNRALYEVAVPEDKLKDIKTKTEDMLWPRKVAIEVKKGKLFLDLPLGQKGNVRPIDALGKLWPEEELTELKLWPIHRRKLYYEGNID